MLSFRVFANQNLRRPLNSLHFPLPLFDFPSPTKLFKINTYKSLSKQRTLTSFRMNTYEKQGGGGLLWLTSPLPSSNFPTYLQPSFAFNRFHTFSFSVSCNSFISLPAVAGHSYESCRVISTLPLLVHPEPRGELYSISISASGTSSRVTAFNSRRTTSAENPARSRLLYREANFFSSISPRKERNFLSIRCRTMAASSVVVAVCSRCAARAFSSSHAPNAPAASVRAPLPRTTLLRFQVGAAWRTQGEDEVRK